MHHLSAAQKDSSKRKLAFWLEKEMGSVWQELEADIPRSLKLEDQGRFQVGYFHQRFAKTDKTGAENPVVDETEPDNIEVIEESQE